MNNSHHDFEENKNQFEMDDNEVKKENHPELSINYNDTNFEHNNVNTYKEEFKVPISLKKTFKCSVTLLVLGITLFILGFISQVAEGPW